MFAYAILRSIPNKLGGVVALAMSIVVLFFIPFVHSSRQTSHNFRPLAQVLFWLIVVNVLLLTWLGGQPVEYPYIFLGQAASVIYFVNILLFIPIVGYVENKLLFS